MTQHDDSSAAEHCWGYRRDLDSVYKRGKQLGKGGNAAVIAVSNRETGAQFACKVLPKTESNASLTAARRAMQPQIVRNEARLLLMRGPQKPWDECWLPG